VSELVTWRDPRPGVAAVMLHSLQGFLDAGSAGRLAVERILAECPNRIVAEFDIDDLYDYRARRPRMTFLSDHYGQVDLPQLVVHEVDDLTGTPFLLLHGPEPDFRWQRFVAAVRHVVAELQVQRVVGMHAVPWPAPHTRPVGITAHATDRSMIPDATSWVGALEVPGHVAGMLELSLGEHGHDAMGFAAHVPHYLVNVEYPRAALALLEAAAASTGLVLPFDALREAAARSDAEIAAQVASDPDNVEAVQAMEVQYDALVQQRGLPVVDEELPSGEEIAAQVEQFLADRSDGES
jgi:hypothetical protein